LTGASPSAPPPRVISATTGVNGHLTSQPLSQEFLSKLNQLEKLQYQLTKQVKQL